MATNIRTQRIEMLTDTNLILRLKSIHINEPVQELYRTYYESVVYYLKGQGCDEMDAGDIFQETVLTFIDQVRQNKFRGESSIKTYFTGIAKNLWLNQQRSSLRRVNREQTFHTQSTDTDTDVHHRIYSKENRARLNNLFEAIGDMCKKILTGFYYENRSMKELLILTNYENEQVLRNKKSKCMKHLKDLITTNKELSETFQTFLKYDQ